MVTAFVMIRTDPHRIPEAAQEIADIDGVRSVYSVTGDWDLVAMAEMPDFEQLATLTPGPHLQSRGHPRHRDDAGLPHLLEPGPRGRLRPRSGRVSAGADGGRALDTLTALRLIRPRAGRDASTRRP